MRSFIASAVVLALAALPSVLARPVRGGPVTTPVTPPFKGFTNCPVKSRPPIIAGLTDDTSLSVQFVGLGLGTQNYTCNANGTYTSIGAVAKLYDISCLADLPFYANITQFAFDLGGLPQRAKVNAGIQPHIGGIPALLGDHFFITNPSTGVGISPVFSFTKTNVVAAKVAAVNNPVNATANVALLQLSKVTGNMGNFVYRLNTIGGQPPASCTPGTPDKTVPYTAAYWFTGPKL